jgi:8-oxo-dGTP pyrophosphatase MutT (NUDIX family)
VNPSTSTQSDAEPAPAATVVVLRDGPSAPEILMVRRHDRSSFMAGAHVFPGGRVDATDEGWHEDPLCEAEVSAGLADLSPARAGAVYVAAVRELFEEVGVLLACDRTARLAAFRTNQSRERFLRYRRDVHEGTRTLRQVIAQESLRLALGSLVPFARWVTPPIDVRRFDTWFFMTRMPPQQSPAHDERETSESRWITAADAIAHCRRGSIFLPPPTWTTMRELEPFATVEDALAWARRRSIPRREPKFLVHGDRNLLVLPGDPLSTEQILEQACAETRFELKDGRWVAVDAH